MEKVLLEETLINIYQRGYRRLNIAELNKYLDELNLICFYSFFVSVNAFCYFQPNWFSFWPVSRKVEIRVVGGVALKRNSSRLSKTTLMITRFRYIGDNKGDNDVICGWNWSCSVVRSLICMGQILAWWSLMKYGWNWW